MNFFPSVDPPTTITVGITAPDDLGLYAPLGAYNGMGGATFLQIGDEVLRVRLDGYKVFKQATLQAGVGTVETELSVDDTFVNPGMDVYLGGSFDVATETSVGYTETATVTAVHDALLVVAAPVGFTPAVGEALRVGGTWDGVTRTGSEAMPVDAIDGSHLALTYRPTNATYAVGTGVLVSRRIEDVPESRNVVSARKHPGLGVTRPAPVTHAAGELVQTVSPLDFIEVLRAQQGSAAAKYLPARDVTRLFTQGDFLPRADRMVAPQRIDLTIQNTLNYSPVGIMDVQGAYWNATTLLGRRTTKVRQAHVSTVALGDWLRITAGPYAGRLTGYIQRIADETGVPIPVNSQPFASIAGTWTAGANDAPLTFTAPTAAAGGIIRPLAGSNGQSLEFLLGGTYSFEITFIAQP